MAAVNMIFREVVYFLDALEMVNHLQFSAFMATWLEELDKKKL